MRIVIAHIDPAEGVAWQQALADRLPGADVRIDSCTSFQPDYAVGWKPPLDFFDRHPGLKAFFSCGAGVDHLMAHPGLPSAMPVFRLEDAGMAALMADYCLHELLRIAGRHDAYAKAQTSATWLALEPLPRAHLAVGVLGMGVLGRQVAHRLAEAGFPVVGHARTPDQTGQTFQGGLPDRGPTAAGPSELPNQLLTAAGPIDILRGPEQLAAFLARTRVLILLAPLTPQTQDLIDAQVLSQLQADAWLINVARGGLVVDQDLITALDDGHLAGATLDVFREEPLPASHPFWHHPKIRITPHVSAPTQVAVSADQVASKLATLQRGHMPSGLIERHRGY